MSNPRHEATSLRARTFVPQLKQRRDRLVYEGRIGAIGATAHSRYRLVAVAALGALVLLVVTALISPVLNALAAAGIVALVAGGWPAATGVAELRRVHRIYSHSVIILLAGLSSVALSYFDHSTERLSLLPAVAAVGVLASFIVELWRGEGAEGRLESVISCISGVLASVSVAGWIGIAGLYHVSRDTSSVLIVGLSFAVILAIFGIRLISAGPKEGPRRGAVTLGVTPVAFVGVIGYVTAIFLTPVIG